MMGAVSPTRSPPGWFGQKASPMKSESIEHRGYRFAVIHMPPVWNVQIFRTHKDLAKPGCSEEIVLMEDRDEAIAEAARRVDAILPRKA